MVKTAVKQRRTRGWMAALVALACVQAWLGGMGHTYCADTLNAIFASIELEIVVPIAGVCVAAYVGLAVAIASMTRLRWQTLAVLVAVYVIGTSALLITLNTMNPSKAWVIPPVLISAAAALAIGVAVRRIPPASAAILGLFAAAACFAITYAVTPFTGSGACGFAP